MFLGRQLGNREPFDSEQLYEGHQLQGRTDSVTVRAGLHV